MRANGPTEEGSVMLSSWSTWRAELSPQENCPPSPGGAEKASSGQRLSLTPDTSQYKLLPLLCRVGRPGSRGPRPQPSPPVHPHRSPRHFVEQRDEAQKWTAGRAGTLQFTAVPTPPCCPPVPVETLAFPAPEEIP